MVAKVSIIVPVYKTEPYLRQCLDSLVNQKLRDIEIICVDDGSPDNSGKILDEYAEEDKRVHVIHQENKGLGWAYNAGRKIATGEYIGFLDSDDWAEPTTFYDLYKAAANTKADVVKASSMFLERHDGTEVSVKFPAQKCNRLIENLMEVPEFVTGHATQWTAIYKRSFLDENYIYSPNEGKRLTPDIAFIWKVWVLAKSLYIVPNAYIHYRQRSDAATKQGPAMALRLVRAHEEATRAIAGLPGLHPYQWAMKSRVEYDHFLYNWYFRCKEYKLEYLRHFAKLFRDAIRLKHAQSEMFTEHEWNMYQFVAYLPFLFYLNDRVKFWVKKPQKDQSVVTTCLFGLFKVIRTSRWVKYYFLGIPYWSERVYDEEFRVLMEMNTSLRNELHQLKSQLEGRRK